MKKILNIKIDGNKRKIRIDTDKDDSIYWNLINTRIFKLQIHYTVDKKQIFYLYIYSNVYNEDPCIEILDRNKALKFLLENWGTEFNQNDLDYFGKYFPELTDKTLNEQLKN
ncbi:MAG: hypothetical protein QW046_01890 [Candidatus Micrarchaeaceae archaeon]